MKRSQTSRLSWFGTVVALVGICITFLAPTAGLVIFIIGIGGIAVNIWIKNAEDQTRRQEVTQERQRTDVVAESKAIQSPEHEDSKQHTQQSA